MSTVEDVRGNKLQTQDSDLLWSIAHYEEEDSELGEEVCSFTHVPGTGDQAELCRAGVKVGKPPGSFPGWRRGHVHHCLSPSLAHSASEAPQHSEVPVM